MPEGRAKGKVVGEAVGRALTGGPEEAAEDRGGSGGGGGGGMNTLITRKLGRIVSRSRSSRGKRVYGCSICVYRLCLLFVLLVL